MATQVYDLTGSAAATDLNTAFNLMDGMTYTVEVVAGGEARIADAADGADVPRSGHVLARGRPRPVVPQAGETIYIWSADGSQVVLSEGF